MVSSDESNSFWVPYFQSKQEKEGFNTVITSIDEVSHKEIVGIWAFTTNFKEFFQIVELTMDVTANLKKSKGR